MTAVPANEPGIGLDVDDGLAMITVANPGRRNALTAALSRELAEVCDRIDRDTDVGAVVIRGADGFFCSGGDREELAAVCADPTSTANMTAIEDVYAAFLRVAQLRAPVVAAVRGGALGAGLNLALACDVRVVAEDAQLGSGFIRLGIHPGGGHYGLLATAVGPQTATVMGLLAESLDGPRAVELGLAWRAVPDFNVEQEAVQLVRLPAQDPELARRAKASLRAQCGPPPASPLAGVQVERAPQLWSFARKGSSGWQPGERAVD